MNNLLSNYFSLPQLLKIIKLSIPSVSVYLGLGLIQITCVIFVGKLGAEYLSAFALASGFFNICLLFCIGLNTASGVLCGHGYGSKDDSYVSISTVQGLWVGSGAGVFMWIILPFVEIILTASGQPTDIIPLTKDVTIILFMALPFASIFSVLRNFLTAIEEPYILIEIIVCAFISNLLLLFIFVELLDLGVIGAASAFTLNNFLLALWSLCACCKCPKPAHYKIAKNIFKIVPSIIAKILKTGIPSGLSIFLEVSTFQIALFMVGTFGHAPLNAHEIAVQVISLSIMFPIGVGQAMMTQIGNLVGAKEYSKMLKTTGSSIGMVAIIVLICSVLTYIFRVEIVELFTLSTNPLFKRTLEIAIPVLTTVAFLQVFDAGQTIFTYVLRGVEDTKVPMYIIFVFYASIGLVLSYFFGFYLGMETFGIWIALTISIMLTNLFMAIRTIQKLRPYKSSEAATAVLLS